MINEYVNFGEYVSEYVNQDQVKSFGHIMVGTLDKSNIQVSHTCENKYNNKTYYTFMFGLNDIFKKCHCYGQTIASTNATND